MNHAILKAILFILATGFSSGTFCQDWDFDNQVPNPSFEYCHFLPSYYTDNGANFTNAVKNWFAPNKASTDILSSKFRGLFGKDIKPHSGENMAGLSVPDTYWGEYVAVEMAWPIRTGRQYYVEFWVAMAKSYLPEGTPQVLSPAFGLLFDYELFEPTNKRFRKEPHVALKNKPEIAYGEWTKISDTIEAPGPYTHLYIGQFDKPTGVQAVNGYFFIDDVKVKEVVEEKLPPKAKPVSETVKILESSELLVLDNVYFETNSFVLKSNSFDQLNEVAHWLSEHPQVAIRINGHTDSVGSSGNNLALSQKRAESVKQYFLEKGIGKPRIDVRGFGELMPVSDNTTSEGRRKNRRVEIEVLEK